MSSPIGKQIRLHHDPKYGPIREYELPKNKFGFRHIYELSATDKLDAADKSDYGVTPNNIALIIRDLNHYFRAGEISGNSSLALSYFLELRLIVGQWVGICPEQHTELIPAFMKKYNLWNYVSDRNPGLELFAGAQAEMNYIGIPYIGKAKAGTREIVFANTLEVRKK